MFESIIGQEQALRTIGKMLESKRIPHTLLFSGPNGVGKSETAFEMARALLCENGPAVACGKCGPCIRASRLEHPDLHLLFPFKAQPQGADGYTAWMEGLQAHRKLLAEERYAPIIYEKNRQIVTGLVTEVHDRLHETSFEGGRRVCLILNAERLNVKTANSLLKILEEPPDGVHFIMTAERLSSMLPTITSRSSIIRFRRLKFEEIAGYLEANGVTDIEKRDVCARAAESSLKLAKSYAFGAKGALSNRAFDLYAGVAEGKGDDVIEGVFQFQWSRDIVEAEELINEFARVTGDVFNVKVGHGIPSGMQAGVIERLSKTATIKSLDQLAKSFENSLDMLGRNVSISMVMTTLLYEIQDAYRQRTY